MRYSELSYPFLYFTVVTFALEPNRPFSSKGR